MLKLHNSEFIRLKQLKNAGFKDSDFIAINKFLEYTSSLPIDRRPLFFDIARKVALLKLTNKLEECKKQLIRTCNNADLNDNRWDSYRIAHRRLKGFLALLFKHS